MYIHTHTYTNTSILTQIDVRDGQTNTNTCAQHACVSVFVCMCMSVCVHVCGSVLVCVCH